MAVWGPIKTERQTTGGRHALPAWLGCAVWLTAGFSNSAERNGEPSNDLESSNVGSLFELAQI
jgi:hypothetical protein